MAQILPHRGWLVTFTHEATVGENPLGGDYAALTLRLFTGEAPFTDTEGLGYDEMIDDADPRLSAVVVRPDADAAALRSRPGVASVLPVWYLTPDDPAYDDDLRGRRLDRWGPGEGVVYWTDFEEALAAMRGHLPTNLIAHLRLHPDAPHVRALAAAALDGDEVALGPLADALTERADSTAPMVRLLYHCRDEAMRAGSWSPPAECGPFRALFPGGRLAVSGVPKSPSVVWEVETGRVVHTWTYPAQAAAVSPRGDRVALVDWGRVRVVAWPPGPEPVASWEEHTGVVAFSPDGRLVASGGGGTVTVREGDRVVAALQASFPAAVAFSPDGRHLVCADARGATWWRTSDWAQAGTLAGRHDDRSGFASVCFPADGTVPAACRPEGVFLWGLGSGCEVRICRLPWACRLQFSPDGRLLAAAAWCGHVHLLRLPDLYLWASWGAFAPLRDRDAGALAFLPGGRHLLTQGRDGPPVVWNLAPLLAAGP